MRQAWCKQYIATGRLGWIELLCLLLLVCSVSCQHVPTRSGGPYLATGIKIGEVTDSRAIVWVRLTSTPERVGDEGPMPTVLYKNPKTGALEAEPEEKHTAVPVVQFPKGATVETLEGAAPGTPGDVRLVYWTDNEESSPRMTPWASVDPNRDFTHQFVLDGLVPNTLYRIKVETRRPNSQAPGASLYGQFRTAPLASEPARVVFGVSTGQEYMHRDMLDLGFRIYPAMQALEPHFFVHTGDIVYYDHLAKSVPLARWHWWRVYSLPTNREFHRRVPAYFIKDDHDTFMNDCWPGMKTTFMGEFTFEQGQALFLEQVPMGEKTYRTFRWGKDLQIWLVEGRDFRSPNTMPDGPEKTIWGREQKEWFKKTVAASDATFRVLISPTPLVGPDRARKGDNHANSAFASEGKELRTFLASQKDMIVICGDRHWQYVSIDPETGLREYSCGPASDEHAGGWSQDDKRPQHKYLNVVGGFLAVEVTRVNDMPTLILRHCDVNGRVLHEDLLTPGFSAK
ncbi:MAG TPA: alkaline phosphatase D family protein [Candidatus Hydrogenedentes bacterium]|nr:alkaline phosphatase D family protein [Candidatus Hydrogenedentota bacterium]HOL76265.1 alkaline phosphatase D family protein [Candidatus Hydrogenedentota bacterium]HPO86804.1 alkaline phosphatase D family protein [Candidatus Hydrogenedentota bacterium]